jgi:hypothetical protein
MRILFIIFIIAVVTGCSGDLLTISSPYEKGFAGRHLVLTEPLTIPPNEARVRIQYGKLVRSADIDQYNAHCWFQSWVVLDTAQIIKPDTFDVIDTQKNEEISKIQTQVLVASTALSSNYFVQGGAAAVEYSTEYTIYSNLQPNIRRLVCNHWQNPSDGAHLKITEIQDTLGEIAKIKATKTVRGKPTIAELYTAVGRYTDAYEEGDIAKLKSLFSYYVKTNAGYGVGKIEKDYSKLFASTTDRQIFIENIDWSIKDRLAKGKGDIKILTIPTHGIDVVSMSGKIEIGAEKINNKLLFTHLYNIKSDE